MITVSSVGSPQNESPVKSAPLLEIVVDTKSDCRGMEDVLKEIRTYCDPDLWECTFFKISCRRIGSKKRTMSLDWNPKRRKEMDHPISNAERLRSPASGDKQDALVRNSESGGG